jgi:D-threo-aldose 1-dehydrogenase
VAQAVLEVAWATGIRYFDTAPFYGFGKSEKRIGCFLQTRPRSEFVLSTKVGRLIRPDHDGDLSTAQVKFDYSSDGAMRSVAESLSRLGLESIDIALIHDIDGWTHRSEQPQRFAEALDGSYRALSDLKSQGVIRAIGLGVNEVGVCLDFAKQVPVDCFLLAGRVTLIEHDAEQVLLPFCEMEGIGVIAGGPFNSGILASGAVEGAQFHYAPADDTVLARVRRLEDICTRHAVPLAAAALAFPLRFPAVASVIPGVAKLAEGRKLAANAEVPIPDALWHDLEQERVTGSR